MKKKKSSRAAEKSSKRSEKSFAGSDYAPHLKEETVQAVLAIASFVLGVFFILAAAGIGGPAGAKVYGLLHRLLGVGYLSLPLLATMLGISFLTSFKPTLAPARIAGSFLFLGSILGAIEVMLPKRGGSIGALLSYPLVTFFDVYLSLVFLLALVAISVMVIFDTRPSMELFSFLRRKKLNEEDEDATEEVHVAAVEAAPEPVAAKKEKEIDIEGPEEASSKGGILGFGKKEKKEEKVSGSAVMMPLILGKPWVPPPLSLLESDKGKPGVGDIKANANIIKRTLSNFGITVEMDEISIGPSVTRYALKPAEGVKLSRIIALQSNLELALAAHPIRIEAPIPGKSLVGIEIPNSTKTTVGLASLLSSSEYQESPDPLFASLGKGISGKSHFSNIAKMPHLLIAGATGSGKSVTIHAIITSLLFRNSPNHLKLIMVDPKRVELTLYNKIPHLLTPVITEAKKSILALRWAAKEMDRRYDILEGHAVRDIKSYHTTILAPALKKAEKQSKEGEAVEVPEPMPYIVIIVDELADIMQTYPRELEAAIVRLAQMSRAVGIHLILSTQRPSVNVITGLIKANVPARIALQVASQIDSRTILDAAGAEKLLGAGDMLYLSGDMSKPARIQSAFITETEVKKVVKYLIDNSEEIANELHLSSDTAPDRNAIFEAALDEEDSDGGDDDDMYEEAREVIIKAGKGSTSYLQRKLKVGYARAARLMDMLEERGVVGPADGAKPREVLVKGGDGMQGEDSDSL